MNERSTPETDAQCCDCEYQGHMGSVFTAEAGKSHPYGDHVSADFARKLERERDEARKQLNRTLDELYEEQQNHGKTKGNLTERRIERDVWCLKYSKVVSENKAMREAIKEAWIEIQYAEAGFAGLALRVCPNDSAVDSVLNRMTEALAKLKPFLA